MGQRQQGCQQRQRLRHGHARAPQGLLQPGTLRLWRFLPALPHQLLEVLDHRVQGALLREGAQRKTRRVAWSDPTASYSSRTRRDLPMPASPLSSTTCPSPFLDLRPASAQQPQFLLPPHQGRQAL